MKKLFKAAAALALCALVMLAAMPKAQGATVYFMAVNDRLLDLSASTMPATVGGVLYVPYTMLSTSTTGVNLGVYAVYSSVKNNVLVYSSRNQLIFDLQADQTYDLNGQTYEERAIVLNSTVYLPIARVCSVFSEIDWSLSSTDYGYLVRVRSSSAVLEDSAFISAAARMMESALTRYQQENPVAAATESPAAPSPSPSASVSGADASVYLAFTQTEGGLLETVLDALAAQDCRGLFFLTAEQLEQQDDLVRRLIGSGHFVGLCLTAQTGEEALEELERGRALLSAIAHCRLAVALAEGLDEDGLAQVEETGCVCWQTTTDGRDLEGTASARAGVLTQQLANGESARNYLLLDDQAGSTLAALLSLLKQADYQLQAPLATEL